jgi:hypothetical protein
VTAKAPRISSWHSRRLGIAAIILLVLLATVAVILVFKWPFTKKEVISSFEQVSQCDVHVGRFQKIFFPQPGYIVQDVIFRRDTAPGTRPIAKVAKVTCRGSWAALLIFRHRITRMDLEGTQVYIPSHVPPAIRKHAQPKIATTVTVLYANGTVLEIAPRHDGQQTTRFNFPELALSNVSKNKAIALRTLIYSPDLFGALRMTGSVGPLMIGRIAQTRISGEYHLSHDDLGRYKVVGGTLSADGRFGGTLGHAEVAGRAAIPDFEVTRSHHSLGLTVEYNTLVDGIRGDVRIESAAAHFLSSMLTARGAITGEGAKTLALDMDSSQARIEDLLRLFVTADQAPLNGALSLQTHVILPPKHEPFLTRVQLDGAFAIDRAEFTNRATESKVNELSARALGKKKGSFEDSSEAVPAVLRGRLKLQSGTSTFSEAIFAVPGAVASGTGTYNLLNQVIDLRGKLAMHATLSKVAGGVKSVLLKPLDPFFKKDGSGAVLPVRISGTYSHPVFKVSLTKK